mmetsp:Transcript_42973/g.114950  ORF Transcript_42973/g.114950 Transcript_42973/m.114950 type:complete len:105 (+) Transcript_42973:341-655(+)
MWVKLLPFKGSDMNDKFVPVKWIKSERQADSKNTKPRENELCVICFERKPQLQLCPCQHDLFCEQCIVEYICSKSHFHPPRCPLCRATFDILLLAGDEQRSEIK